MTPEQKLNEAHKLIQSGLYADSIKILNELFTSKLIHLKLVYHVLIMVNFFYLYRILDFVTAFILIIFVNTFRLECIKKVILRIFR